VLVSDFDGHESNFGWLLNIFKYIQCTELSQILTILNNIDCLHATRSVHLRYVLDSKKINRMESDRDKFVRLATKRVNNAIKTIQLIGNLSNRGNYDYTDKDVDRIFGALAAEIKICRERFASSGAKNKTGFSLE